MNSIKKEEINVLVYSRRGLGKWSKELSLFLKSNNIESSTFSELRNFADNDLIDEFYFFLNSKFSQKFYDEYVYYEIICRCRLLRSLDYKMAISMIDAMAYSVNQLFEKVKPKVIISLRVDSYVLDIVDKEAKKRGIEYFGVWKSAFKKGYFFITSRGELGHLKDDFVRVINRNDIVNDDFKAVSILSSDNFSVFRSFKIKVYYILRSYYLLFIRYVVNDRFGYRFLTNSVTVPEYKVHLFENNYNKFVKSDWNILLESIPNNKKIFIALQVNPESTIDYYVDDVRLIKYEEVLVKIISHFEKNGFYIFIKDHPNMFGRRSYNFLKKITNFDKVRFVPYHVSSNFLLKYLDIVFTWSGTISVQAVLANKLAIVVNPPYFVEGLYIQIKDYSDIESLFSLINQFDFNMIDENKRTKLIDLINSSLYEGDLNFKNIDYNLFNSLYKLIAP